MGHGSRAFVFSVSQSGPKNKHMIFHGLFLRYLHNLLYFVRKIFNIMKSFKKTEKKFIIVCEPERIPQGPKQHYL